MMYAQDNDEAFPSQQYGGEQDGNDVNWLSVLQPYIENQKIVGASNKAADGSAASKIGVCPSQFPGYKLAATATVSMSYGFMEWAVGSRDKRFGSGPKKASVDPRAFRAISEFANPASTILLAEIGNAYSQASLYPIDNDPLVVQFLYVTSDTQRKDVDFTAPAKGASKPAWERIPGITGYSHSNVDDKRHFGGSSYLFSDGHVKWQKLSQTYKSDGSFSQWTLSGKWDTSPHPTP